jgi:ribose 5-phosphate isomerase A
VADDTARAAAAAAAAELVDPGMTIGLGSGRAVWKVIEHLRGRKLRAVFASERTRELAVEAGIEEAHLDGATHPALAIDGADEVYSQLGLIKGGGAALLREKIVIAAADRFVVVAEIGKRVDRLGATGPLPVEVVRFGWRDTRRRLLEGLVAGAELRADDRGEPIVTDEGHHILDCDIPDDADVNELGRALKGAVGVVEHGLFLGMASVALLGTPEGRVERLEARRY